MDEEKLSVDCGSAADRETGKGGSALGKRRCYGPQPDPGPESEPGPEPEAAIKALDACAGVLCVLRFADCMQPAATATGCYCYCYCSRYRGHCVYYTVAQIRCCTSRAELVDGRVSLGLNVEDSLGNQIRLSIKNDDDDLLLTTTVDIRQAHWPQASSRASKSPYTSLPPSSHHRWSAALARACQDLPPPAPPPRKEFELV